ncbi:MAG: hypothetical protein J6A28_04070 [Clostridia bacterium]|nr:hypothetical protein [Clostridia bacterium]
MISMLASIESFIASLFQTLTASLGFLGYLLIAVGVEVLFVIAYGIKSAFSYEARFKRAMNKANVWLYKNKKLTADNIRSFTNVLKKGPKRITHFWQQYIMYREGGPAAYLSEENMIEKPLRTSSWLNNVKNLGILTAVWAIFSAIMGFAAQVNKVWGFSNALVALILPLIVVLIGGLSAIAIKGFRNYNLDDVYEGYHIFIRFLTNGCDELPPYIEIDFLFTKKELSRASRDLKEFYESNARKAKEAFEEAKKNEEATVEYNFKEVGVDGALLLDRAMKESENYINQKTKLQSQIAQIEAQKDAMRRNFENIQMDLQRKIQASKENIQKLIEQQAATTSRIEVGLLRQQQDKEAKKLDELQRDYDKEETRFKADRDEHEKEIARLYEIKDKCLAVAERGMSAEYQSFFEKVMKAAYSVSEKRVEKEKKELIKENDKKEQELINVQTQIKRLLDENVTLRSKLGEYNPEFANQEGFNGHYNENGNFVYQDGSYHDDQGLFHSAEGDVFNMNGEKVSKDYTEEEIDQNEREAIVKDQIDQFGSYIDVSEAENIQEDTAFEPTMEESEFAPAEELAPQYDDDFGQEEQYDDDFEWEDAPAPSTEQQPQEPAKAPIIEDFQWEEEEQIQQPQQHEIPQAPIDEDFAFEEEPQTETQDYPVEEDFIDQPAPIEEKAAEEKAQPAVASGKKRGRPRKAEAPVAPAAPSRGRGRPRKEETAAAPRSKEALKAASPSRGRGRPRKTETPAAPATPSRGRGRPRKDASEDVGSVARINQLIREEEEKLNKMKDFLNNELSQVMTEGDVDADREKENLAKEFEDLKTQAEKAKDGGSSDELISINNRLDQLIKEINTLNNKK